MPLDIDLGAQIDLSKLTVAQRNAIGGASTVFQIYKNDIQFNTVKGTTVIDGTSKLVQGILKILLTDLGTHLESSLYGTDMMKHIGDKLDNSKFALIRDSVNSSLSYYNELAAPENPNPDEVIYSIDEIRVSRDDVDPRVVYVYISVTTKLGTSVRIALARGA